MPYTFQEVGPGGYLFLSAAECLTEYERNSQAHALAPLPEFPDMYWHKSWIPFMFAGANRLYVDCDRQLFDPWFSPVRQVIHTWDCYDVDVTPSVGTAFAIWVWLLEEGYYRWNPQPEPLPRWEMVRPVPAIIPLGGY
jgi:hypothetical protein